MTESSINSQVLTLRKTGGYAVVGNLGLIGVSGVDAGKFLQFRTTNDVLSLKPGQGQLNSLLDRTAHLQGVVSVHRLEDGFWVVAEKSNIKQLIAQMEQYHIAEKLEIKDLTAEGTFFSVQGPSSLKFLAAVAPQAAAQLANENDLCPASELKATIIRKSLTGEDGFLFWIAKEQQNTTITMLQQAAKDLGLIELSAAALDIARIEAGIPIFGVDMSGEDLLADTGLEEATVSFTKGCYLGQEVIARMKTYSAPRKGMVGLVFAAGAQPYPAINIPLIFKDKEIGSLRSSAYSPTLEKTIALAYVSREYRVPDTELELKIADRIQVVRVQLLPFYKAPSRQQRARKLYDQGLAAFAADDNSRAVTLLREALELDPVLADGYEALGVILSKLDQLNEAVLLMKRLAEIDPTSIMSHTNLSIFYMQLGNKEAAEEEKAIAMSLQMQKVAEEFKTQQKETEDKQRLRDEALQRIEMFKEVLAIDQEDQLANYGLGNLYVEIKDFEKAIPHLQKAVSLKPNHTVAYLALGSAYEGIGQTTDALNVYQQGIAVAARRGDMTPLKTMQQRLEQLKSGSALL